MENDNIVDVDADAERVSELMQTATVATNSGTLKLGGIVSDIQTAHKELDEYKSGALSLSQTLSEAAKETDDEVERAILADLSDGAFGVYLRLTRGDVELMGGRDGDYSGYLAE